MVETNSPIYDYKYYDYGWIVNKCKFSDRVKLLSLLFFLVSQGKLDAADFLIVSGIHDNTYLTDS